MNKSAIIATYDRFRKQHRLTIKEAVLSAGGALLMLGLRKETEDLDLDIPAELYDRLKRKGAKVVTTSRGEHLVLPDLLGEVAAHRGLRTDIKWHVVGGVCCYCPEELLKQKVALANNPERTQDKRAQDMDDIVELENLLRKSA
jgi:hypothetical protein